MNRVVMFCAGLLLVCSMSGCCLLGYGYGAGYPGYGGGYGGGCGSCGSCGTYPSAYAPGGATAFAPAGPTTAYAPMYPTTVAMDPLSTY